MKLSEILGIGASLVGTAYPPLGLAIKAVNMVLPPDHQLPESATGNDVYNHMDSLPSDVQLELMGKEIDLEIQEVKSHEAIQIALASADATGSSTRPYIAKMMAWAVLLTVLPLAWVFSYAVVTGDDKVVAAIADNYLVILALIGTPTTLLVAYFGMRTKEKAMRQAVAHGHPPPLNPLGIIGKLLK